MADADGRYVITYNGEVYNFRELRAELEALGHRVPLAHRHRGRAARATPSGATDALERFNGMFALRALGPRDARAAARARPLRDQAALLRAQAGDAFAVRLRDQGAPRAPRRSRAELDREALLEYFTFQNLFTDRTLFDGVQLLPAGCVPDGRDRPDGARRARALLGLRLSRARRAGAPTRSTSRSSTGCSARPSSASSSRDVPVGSYLSGGMDSGRSPRSRRRSSTTCRRSRSASTCSSASGIELGFDERAQRRARCPTSSDRALRDGAEGRRHGARDAAARLAPRGAARRPELPELLRRAARQQVRQGRALGRGRRRALRRLSRGATTGRSSTTASRTTSTSTTPTGSACCRTSELQRVFAPDLRPTSSDVRTARHLPRRASPTTHASLEPARGLHQPLALLRGEDLPARAARRRGQALDGALARDPAAVPRQRPRRLRAAASRSA